jgi:hypothetical protein
MGSTWKFASSFDARRRERLATFDTYAKVVEAVTRTTTVVGGWICEATDLGVKNCWRPSALLTVSSEAFDAFFNGPAGYRARYLESPEAGQAANGTLLSILEPGLTAAVLADYGRAQLSAEWIRCAFLANSAKIWPSEDELDFVEATPDLDIAQWQVDCETVNAPAGAALWAPEGTSLMAIGAFIDASGNEVVARKKILRRFELHDCGFT